LAAGFTSLSQKIMNYALSAIFSGAAVYGYHIIVPSDCGLKPGLKRGCLNFWPEHGYADLPNGKTHYYLLD
jgi:hypothetical protein